MNMFTCGELKQLTFNSYDDKCVMGESGIEFKEGRFYPDVDMNKVYDLYKNTKDVRYDKKDKKRTTVARISSEAQILKINNEDELNDLGFTVDYESKELRMRDSVVKRAAVRKIDGVYITKELAQKLSEKGFNVQEHLKVFNSRMVSSGDSKHQYGQRAYKLSPEIKKITKEINDNNRLYENQVKEFSRLRNERGVFKAINGKYYMRDIDENGNKKYTDVEHKLDIIEKYIDFMYDEGKKDEGFIKKAGISKNEHNRSCGNCFGNITERKVIMDSAFLLSYYNGLKYNSYFDNEIKKELNIKAVAKSVYYHELGHIMNNVAHDTEIDKKLEKNYGYSADVRRLPVSVYREYLEYNLMREKQATDYALNRIEKENEIGVSKKAAVATLTTALSTYIMANKERLKLGAGRFVKINDTKYVLF